MSVVPHTRQPSAQLPDIPLQARHRWVALLGDVSQLAHAINNTEFVPKGMRGNEAAIVAAIMYGDEVGLTPMQSLAKIAVIDGKPSLAAEAQRALILAAGHYIWPEELGTTKVTWAGRRADLEQVTRVTWTLDDAKRAGLAGKPNWRSYPRAMLSARASAELARAVFADVIGGLAATEELEDVVEGTVEPEPEPAADTAPAPTRRRRTTKRAVAPVVAPVPPAPPSDAPPEPPLPDEADQPPPKATQPQLRKLFAMFNEHGLADRDDRLDWANAHLDRVIVSASELTDIEASRLIEALDEEPVSEALPADDQPVADDSAPAQQTLDHGLLGPDGAEILLGMRREAGVDDAWVRNKLAELGVKVEGRITRTALQQLTREQADQLQAAFNAAIDAGLSQGE